MQSAAAGMLLVCTLPTALADPPAQASPTTPANPPAEGQDLTPHGSFLSSLKQGFGQDVEHESVRGHFDVTVASGTRISAGRYPSERE